MATWEDGPEYAPLVRPDEFALPDAPPLSVAEPYVQPAAGAPVDRPSFGGPQAPVAPLAELVPAPEDPRDPTAPFAVVSSTMTGDSAWGAVHSSSPTAPITTTSGSWAHQAPAEASPFGGYAAAPLPTPGTDQWFAPGGYAPAPRAVPVTAKDVVAAVTPALIIVLALGGLIHPVAPITLLVAWGLSSRVTVARREIQIGFVAAVALVAVLGLFIGFAGALDFADWWNGLSWVALFASWGMMAVVIGLAVRALRSGRRPAPRPGSWG